MRDYLGRHFRFVLHYTPKSASWFNVVEGFFAKLSKRRLKRGVFRSLVDLQAAIRRFLAETDDSPKPFVWSADPDQIISASGVVPSVRFDPLDRAQPTCRSTMAGRALAAGEFGATVNSRVVLRSHEFLLVACAVKRRRFPVGARQTSLQ